MNDSREVSQNSPRPESEQGVAGEHTGALLAPDSVCAFCNGEHSEILHPTDEDAARRLWIVIGYAEAELARHVGRLRRIREIIESQHGRWMDTDVACSALRRIELVLNEERR